MTTTTTLTLSNRARDFDGRPRVVIVTGPGFQDHDNIYCGYRFREAYFRVVFATADGSPVSGRYGTVVPLDRHSPPCISFDDLDVDCFELVVLTGGHEAPDRVRQDQRVKDFVHDMAAAGKIVAGLCHGPWVMISAKIMRGRLACAYPGILDDMEHAGTTVVDADVVVDGNLVTCSYYGEVGLFCKTVIELVEASVAGVSR